MPNSQISLTDDYQILLGGEPIGHIETMGDNDNIIANIEIEDRHQGNRHSQTATELFLAQAKERGVGIVSTSVVISGAYKTVLRDLGFEETNHLDKGLYFSKEL